MFKIKYNKVNINFSNEIEIESDEKTYGFNVSIEHKNYGDIVYNNVTEVHWGYNFKKKILNNDNIKVAIESDLHGTGVTLSIDDITSLKITDAAYLRKTFVKY